MKNYKTLIICIISLILLGVATYFVLTIFNSNDQTIIKSNITEHDENTTYVDLDSTEIEGTGLAEEDGTIYIASGGTYEFSGTLTTNIIVDVKDDKDVTIVLNGVSIISDDAPIKILQGDTTITIKDGSSNYIEYTKAYNDNEEINGAIYASDDLIINGNGTLKIKSTYNGISGKDTVTIESGTYNIEAYNGIKGKDYLVINGGTFTIKTSNDGLKATNDTDNTLGYVEMNGGTFDITASGDGIQGITKVVINNGNINIAAAEGIEATYIVINDGTINISASDDGINASNKSTFMTPTVEINGGNITINMGQGDTDGVDANGDIVINGGTINVTGQSTFDYDGTGVINGGTVTCNGKQVTTLPNQFMNGGMAPGNMTNNQNNGTQNNQQNMEGRRR